MPLSEPPGTARRLVWPPRATVLGLALLLAGSVVRASPAAGAIASGEVRLSGVALSVSPSENVHVPRHTPLALSTALRDGAGNDISGAPEYAGMMVRGELSGPGLEGMLALETSPGSALEVPALPQAGNYIIDNLRLADAGGSTGLAADPSLITIEVVEKVLVSQVTTRRRSLDGLEDGGVGLLRHIGDERGHREGPAVLGDEQAGRDPVPRERTTDPIRLERRAAAQRGVEPQPAVGGHSTDRTAGAAVPPPNRRVPLARKRGPSKVAAGR